MVQTREHYDSDEAQMLQSELHRGQMDPQFDRIAKEFNSPKSVRLETLGRFCDAYVSRANLMLKHSNEDLEKLELEKHAKQYAKTKEIIDELALDQLTPNSDEIKEIDDPKTIITLLTTCTEIFKSPPYKLNLGNFDELEYPDIAMEGLYKLSDNLLDRLYNIFDEVGTIPVQLFELSEIVKVLDTQQLKIREKYEKRGIGDQNLNPSNESVKTLALESKLWDLVDKQSKLTEINLGDVAEFTELYADTIISHYENSLKTGSRAMFNQSNGKLFREISELSKDRNTVSDFTDGELLNLLNFSSIYFHIVKSHTSKRVKLGPPETNLKALKPFYLFFKKVYDETKGRELVTNPIIDTEYKIYTDWYGSHTE